MSHVVARKLGLIFGVLGLCLLAACATPTPYQPAVGDRNGYRDQALENNRYLVVFTGNSLTPRQTVELYLLYRAAEITVQTGNDYFIVVSQETERATVYESTFSSLDGYGFYGYPYYYRPFPGSAMVTGTSVPISSYEAQAIIVVGQGDKPDNQLNAYNAREVLKRLGPLIIRSNRLHR